jgi:hypothetical protein
MQEAWAYYLCFLLLLVLLSWVFCQPQQQVPWARCRAQVVADSMTQMT